MNGGDVPRRIKERRRTQRSIHADYRRLDWADDAKAGSVFNRMDWTQMVFCCRQEQWRRSDKIVDLVRSIPTRFICQLCVEEMFNRVKRHMDFSSNTKCSASHAFAAVIDKQSR